MSAPSVTIPVDRLTQWAFVVSRLSGAISGTNAAFGKRGEKVQSLTDSEVEADALRAEMAALIFSAAMPTEGGRQ